MLVRHHHEGRVYVVDFPQGTRVFRSELAAEGMLVVPWEGRDVPIFEKPGELIVQLAEGGDYGMRLVAFEGPQDDGGEGRDNG